MLLFPNKKPTFTPMKIDRTILGFILLLFYVSFGFAQAETSKFPSDPIGIHTITAEKDSQSKWQNISAESFAYSINNQENFGFGLTAIKVPSFDFSIFSEQGFKKYFLFSLDQRKLISRYLYPFHFFF